MKKIILLAILLSSTASLAIPGNNGNGKGGCGVGQTTNGCGDSSSGVDNNGFSNQLSSSSIGNINNTSRGGAADAYANSGGNSLSNGQGQDQSMSQGQFSSNAVSGGNTTVNGGSMSSNSNTVFRQASAPAIAPSVAASGNNGVSIGVQTIAGGFSSGISRVDKTQKKLNLANAEYSKAAATGTLVETILKLEGCESDVCKKAQQLVLRKLGGK